MRKAWAKPFGRRSLKKIDNHFVSQVYGGTTGERSIKIELKRTSDPKDVQPIWLDPAWNMPKKEQKQPWPGMDPVRFIRIGENGRASVKLYFEGPECWFVRYDKRGKYYQRSIVYSDRKLAMLAFELSRVTYVETVQQEE